MSKKISFILLILTLITTNAHAEFNEDALHCYTDDQIRVFTIGQYNSRDGLGNIYQRYDRTDFDSSFAKELRSKKMFSFRSTGPSYIDFRNQFHLDNDHRTLYIGRGFTTEFLYVFKPVNNKVTLEIWKLKPKQRRRGHMTVPGDKLIYKNRFNCK